MLCWRTADMELRLIIAYALIAALVVGVSAIIFMVRKKSKARRGRY